MVLPKISKGFNYRKEQSLKLSYGAVDAKPLVTSPTVNAVSAKVILSTGTPQTAPDTAMQTLTNVGQHLQNRSKQRFSWQMDIRVLISNLCIWWSTYKVTWQMQSSPTHGIANYTVQKSHIRLFLYIKALVLK